MYGVRIVTNIGLIYFSGGGLIPALSIAFEVYSLIGISQRNWFEFTKEIDITHPELSRLASKASVTYTFLFQNLYSHQAEGCTICREDQPANELYFCSNHTFHTSCIVEMIQSKINSFIEGLSVQRRNEVETQHYRNGGYTHSTYSANYLITMPRANVPSCPNCREQPAHNEFNVKFNDNRYGWSPTTITWR